MARSTLVSPRHPARSALSWCTFVVYIYWRWGGINGMRFRVGQFNLLCPTYGLKWGEREACLEWRSTREHGDSNWHLRWPALLRILTLAQCDILALEELEESTQPAVTEGLAELGLSLEVFPHPRRRDALGLAFNPNVFRLERRESRGYPSEEPVSASGLIDLRHTSGRLVRAVVTHQKGGVRAQLDDLLAFAVSPIYRTCR
jgi:hypothetical protein